MGWTRFSSAASDPDQRIVSGVLKNATRGDRAVATGREVGVGEPDAGPRVQARF